MLLTKAMAQHSQIHQETTNAFQENVFYLSTEGTVHIMYFSGHRKSIL